MNRKYKFTIFLQSALLIAFLALISGCVPQSKLEYIQSTIADKLEYGENAPERIRISIGDELYIRVSSLDDLAYNFFNTQAENRQMSYGNETAVYMVSYTVNDSGYVLFPTIGQIYLKDFTIEEATQHMQQLLSEYFNQPTVLIKIVNKSVSVLGEVRAPGHYGFTKDKMNVLEAISLAGDVTIHGKKYEVALLREIDNKVNKVLLDLTNDSLLTNPYFYVKSNDVIYVKARHSAHWNLTSSMYSIVLSSITTFLLILNYIQN